MVFLANFIPLPLLAHYSKIRKRTHSQFSVFTSYGPVLMYVDKLFSKIRNYPRNQRFNDRHIRIFEIKQQLHRRLEFLATPSSGRLFPFKIHATTFYKNSKITSCLNIKVYEKHTYIYIYIH